MKERIASYFDTLDRAIRGVECTGRDGAPVALDQAFRAVWDMAHAAHAGGNKIMFIGNGGSAGISSHLAIDFSKNGGLRAAAFNDSAALSCLGNDLGYESVFAQQIEWHGRPGDLLIAISSSGQSPNILNGVRAARDKHCKVVSFSGFACDNPLRRTGEVNFYVGHRVYGFVELAHLALIHAILDLETGWTPAELCRSRQGAT
jgi:D-sedoheptulose 7-phosphate isomerase